jgi:hypothetical protein
MYLIISTSVSSLASADITDGSFTIYLVTYHHPIDIYLQNMINTAKKYYNYIHKAWYWHFVKSDMSRGKNQVTKESRRTTNKHNFTFQIKFKCMPVIRIPLLYIDQNSQICSHAQVQFLWFQSMVSPIAEIFHVCWVSSSLLHGFTVKSSNHNYIFLLSPIQLFNDCFYIVLCLHVNCCTLKICSTFSGLCARVKARFIRTTVKSGS